MTQVSVACVDMDNLLVTLADGRVLRITQMVDKTGEDTTEVNEAVAVVASDGDVWVSTAVGVRQTVH